MLSSRRIAASTSGGSSSSALTTGPATTGALPPPAGSPGATSPPRLLFGVDDRSGVPTLALPLANRLQLASTTDRIMGATPATARDWNMTSPPGRGRDGHAPWIQLRRVGRRISV